MHFSKELCLPLMVLLLAACSESEPANVAGVSDSTSVSSALPAVEVTEDDLSDVDQQLAEGDAEIVTTQKVDSIPVQEIRWEVLIPGDFDLFTEQDKIIAEYDVENITDESPEADEIYQRMQAISDSAPVVESLEGMQVKLPGFIVPLDYQDTTVVRFLLVPYYGACIHTPPPPANQIVYIEPDEPIIVDNFYDAVYATGTLTIDHQDSGMGISGYRMKLDTLEPYL